MRFLKRKGAIFKDFNMGKQNSQIDFSNHLNKRGFYPKCLTMPFVVFVVIVIVLFFVAMAICKGGVPDCCKNGIQSTQIAQIKPKQNDDLPKDVEKIRDDKIGTTTSLGHSKPKEPWQIAQERFLQYNTIDENYKLKESLFFDKNSSFLGSGKKEDFTINLKEKVREAKLAIIFGYGCDLGGEEYNIYLIDKRINRVVEMIKRQYPNMQILTSNEGKAKSVADDEKTREFERRVDIYFY